VSGSARTRRTRAILIGAASTAFGILATSQLVVGARSPAVIVTDLAVGLSLVASGLIVWDRRPANRIGPLAVLTGLAWFTGDFAASSQAVVAYVGGAVHGWFDPLFALLILAYPAGRIGGRIERVIAVGFVATQGAWTAAKLVLGRPLAWWPCPTCPDTADAYVVAQQSLDALGRLETLTLTGLSLALLAVVAHRYATASSAARARQTPALLAGLVLAGGFVVAFLAQTMAPVGGPDPVGDLRVVTLGILRILVAVGLLLGVLRDEVARGRIAELVLGLDRLPPTGVLQASLREALADPSLEVLRWDPAIGGYRDAFGASVSTPKDAPARAVSLIEADGKPLLAIAIDPVLREDPGLVSAAIAAVRLAVENERLQAEVHRQLAEVQASRTRIVEAEAAERRRIERDLHDGAQQRLVSLAISLQMLRRRLGPTPDPELSRELDAAIGEAKGAIQELRELAQGLHPAVLTESGLEAALASLAERSPVPVELVADLDGPIPSPTEATAYFVIAEALANAAKHAGARRVRVTAAKDEDLLRLEVVDDGRGGASSAVGSGLRGLEDRVVALGGELVVDSPVGAGTRIRVELPCASS
jgi:signal transduction histidine kinase